MTAATAVTAVTAMPQAKQSLIVRFAQRFGVDPDKMLTTLKATAFRQRGNNDPEVTNEQMMALLVVAEQYGLNPWTREIYAFPDKGSIVPVVGIDGWARIINEHPQFDGMDIIEGPPSAKHKSAPEWMECVIYRKDRTHPTRVRERLGECYRSTGPWDSHPARMLRHKTVTQCGRLAFGFVGIHDLDEAQRIIEGEATHIEAAPAIAAINAAVAGNPPGPTIESQATTVLADEPQKPADNGSEQGSQQSEPPKAQQPDREPITYAYLADAIGKAQTPDGIALARDLMRGIADDGQRSELAALANDREKAIAKARK